MSGAGRWIAVLAAVAAVGCVPLRTVDKKAPQSQSGERVDQQVLARPSVPPPASDAEYLLSYFQQARALAGPALNREHETARQAYASSRSDFNRVRFAIMLSMPQAVFNDDARALELLAPISRNPGGQLQGLAYLLVAHLQERRRLDSSLQDLQQKLDALKSLERSMIEKKR
ncbi:MAG TPA: hypothetical protein VMN03_11570 [Burkholderiales bacterium]|nr:hypothetical protein [Burkholderiales bacterium]